MSLPTQWGAQGIIDADTDAVCETTSHLASLATGFSAWPLAIKMIRSGSIVRFGIIAKGGPITAGTLKVILQINGVEQPFEVEFNSVVGPIAPGLSTQLVVAEVSGILNYVAGDDISFIHRTDAEFVSAIVELVDGWAQVIEV